MQYKTVLLKYEAFSQKKIIWIGAYFTLMMPSQISKLSVPQALIHPRVPPEMQAFELITSWMVLFSLSQRFGIVVDAPQGRWKQRFQTGSDVTKMLHMTTQLTLLLENKHGQNKLTWKIKNNIPSWKNSFFSFVYVFFLKLLLTISDCYAVYHSRM